MGINIYSAANPSTGLSVAGAFTSPFTVVLDGKYGGVTQKKLYLRNSDSALWYSLTTILCVDTIDVTIVDGTKNITWKLSAGNTQPTDDQWAAITTGNTISMANLGGVGSPDTSTYLPFWVRVQIPRNIEVQTILDVKLKINTTQGAV
jgi:hypothetical protein